MEKHILRTELPIILLTRSRSLHISGSYFFIIVGTSGSLTQTNNEAYHLHGVARDHMSGRGVYFLNLYMLSATFHQLVLTLDGIRLKLITYTELPTFLKLATTEDSCHSLNERLIPNSSTKLTCHMAYPEVCVSKGFTSCASHSRLSS